MTWDIFKSKYKSMSREMFYDLLSIVLEVFYGDVMVSTWW
jgi:hypothetical protein